VAEPDLGVVPETEAIRQEGAKGFVWTVGQTLFVRLLSLVGFVVLARLLTPRDYGLAALATAFTSLFWALAASGISAALVQQETVDRTDLDTAFCLGMVSSAALTGVLVLAAWPLADAFGQPGLRPVLQVLAISLIFVGTSSTHSAVLQRRFDFAALAAASVISNVVATVVGLTFAFVGFGVWSLVVQTVLSIAVNALIVIGKSGYWPGTSISRERARPLLVTSGHFMGGVMATLVTQQADNLLVGAVLGPVELGIYTVAYRILTVLLEVLSTSARIVAFPMFSRVQNERERLARAYLAAMRLCSMIVAPVFLFCLVAAPEIVSVVFGQKWAPSVPVMRVLCVYGALQGVMSFNQALLSGVGRARLVFRILLLLAVLQVVGFAIAVSHGIVWVAASLVIVSYVMAPVDLVIAMREVGLSLRAYIPTLLPAFLSAGVMALAVYAVNLVTVTSIGINLRLLLLMAVAAIAYVGVLRAVGASQLAEATMLVTDLFARRKQRPESVPEGLPLHRPMAISRSFEMPPEPGAVQDPYSTDKML
jgi:O-antigen/teichoic acid export membrane protein